MGVLCESYSFLDKGPGQRVWVDNRTTQRSRYSTAVFPAESQWDDDDWELCTVVWLKATFITFLIFLFIYLVSREQAQCGEKGRRKKKVQFLMVHTSNCSFSYAFSWLYSTSSQIYRFNDTGVWMIMMIMISMWITRAFQTLQGDVLMSGFS